MFFLAFFISYLLVLHTTITGTGKKVGILDFFIVNYFRGLELVHEISNYGFFILGY